MCRRAWLALAVVAGCLAAPGEAHGQQTDTPEALRAHLDSLRPLVEEAREALALRRARIQEESRRVAAVDTRVDTLRIGQLTVLTPEGQAAVTEEVFTGVWDEHFAGLGHSPALDSAVFVFQWSRTDEPDRIHVDGEAHRLTFDRWTRRGRVDTEVRILIGDAMTLDMASRDTQLSEWLRADPFRPVRWDQVYRRVATTHSRSTRACLAGDAGACGSAMGLGTERTAEQLEAWYEPDERRALVAAAIPPDSRRWGSARNRCVRERLGCGELMLSYPFEEWSPLTVDVRRTLVKLALEEGGRDSWTRLLEDPSMTPTEALEHASGKTIGDLLDEWQRRLVDSRPRTFQDLGSRTGMALVWTLFFAALAMRSTRWRSG